MYRVLVVGERPEEAKALATRLGLNGFESMACAGDVTVALRSLISFRPDALLLDMHDNAQEVFRALEQVAPVPIFVLGDNRQADEVVWYLEAGASDYLLRPVSPALLAARLTSVLRRRQDNGHGPIHAGELEIDLDRHQVRRSGETIPLTPTEFRLLQVLAENAGRACSHRLLLERVWGDDFRHCAHYLRLYMGYLRQKLEIDPRNPSLLLTEWGVGYRLSTDRQKVPVSAAPQIKAAWA
jgi:two-component system KDP operon response regulator KdpE